MMARTREGAALTRTHHTAQARVASTIERDLATLWAVVDPTDLRATLATFALAVAEPIRERNGQSSAVAARYFVAFRAAEAVTGTVAPRRAEPAPARVVSRVVRNAAAAGILSARRRGFPIGAARQAGLAQATGQATSLVLAGSRDTIIRSIGDDRHAQGWLRVTGGDPCSFCAMIASRGPVFGANTADFEAHYNDQCEPEPYYRGSRMTRQADEFRDLWERATEGKSGPDALNAFRRAREGRPQDGDPILRN